MHRVTATGNITRNTAEMHHTRTVPQQISMAAVREVTRCRVARPAPGKTCRAETVLPPEQWIADAIVRLGHQLGLWIEAQPEDPAGQAEIVLAIEASQVLQREVEVLSVEAVPVLPVPAAPAVLPALAVADAAAVDGVGESSK